jgi:DNA (cytosine-5)-methyltransferase 1
MRFASLFAGIGGFDLGFETAGMQCVAQVEIDKDCQRVLTKQWPNVKRFDDVSKIEKLEPVDLICGGFPCQDLSVAGKRAGLAGERSGLWFEFLRIIKSNLPRFVVIENVPGLHSSDRGNDFAVIVRGLVELGYCVAWRVLDAQYFGVAQRRRRVFIVGSLGNGSCAQILFESEGVSGDSAPRREARERVANAVTTGTGKSSGPRNGNGEPMHLITHALRAEGADASEDGTGRGTPLVAWPAEVSPPLDGSWADRMPGSTNQEWVSQKGGRFVPAPIAFSSKDHGADAGEIAPTMRSQNFRDSHMNGGGQVAIAFHENKSGQLSEAEVLGLRSGASHNYQGIGGSFGVRRLTPRECERLQSFPDNWTLYDAEGKTISDSARYRMLGNAVAVNCAKWIGQRMQL